MIRNINEALGDPVLTDSVESLARDIIASGRQLPADGLKEGRDYDVIREPRYFRHPRTGVVDPEESWRIAFRNSTPREWGGEAFEDVAFTEVCTPDGGERWFPLADLRRRMDPGILADVAKEPGLLSDQDRLDRYMELHEAKFGEPFKAIG